MLRAATGAGVNRHEAEQKIRELTPQWGDSQRVIDQKKAGVNNYMKALEARVGRAAPIVDKARGGAATTPTTTKTVSVDY